MVRAERVFDASECALIEQVSFGEASLFRVQQGEIVENPGHTGVFGTQRLLANGKRTDIYGYIMVRRPHSGLEGSGLMPAHAEPRRRRGDRGQIVLRQESETALRLPSPLRIFRH